MTGSNEHIEVVPNGQPTNGRWNPIVGPETADLMRYFRDDKHLDEEGRATIEGEARNILSKCVSPRVLSGSATGLVVGYVQSGKTMSYTTVAALARDNGYKLLIVVTGISVPLLG